MCRTSTVGSVDRAAEMPVRSQNGEGEEPSEREAAGGEKGEAWEREGKRFGAGFGKGRRKEPSQDGGCEARERGKRREASGGKTLGRPSRAQDRGKGQGSREAG